MQGSGKTALVTGASGGLGAEFSVLLAERGFNLVLTARNADKLDRMAEKLRSNHGVEVLTVPLDLSESGASEALMRSIDEHGLVIDLLVNNAGHGLQGDFLKRAAAETEHMLRLNILSLTALTHAVAADMAARGGGHILMIASMTAFMPAPSYAAYAASKSFVRNFGEALHAELAPSNIAVTVLSPGLMNTGFLDAAGQVPGPGMRQSMISPRMVAQTGLRALYDRRQSVVAGRMNRVAAFLTRLMPRGLQTRLMANALKS